MGEGRLMDPRLYFTAQDAAYSLPASAPGVIETFLGDDETGPVPYGVAMDDGTVAFRGTTDSVEWVEDFDIEQVNTPLGGVARGIQITFGSLRTVSGASLSNFGDYHVCGHSRGGPLALLWAVQFGSPEYCLFACPKLVQSDVLAKLGKLSGMAWHVDGDVVPDVDPFYPSLPKVTRIPAPARTDPFSLSAHHIFATYKAAITAYLPSAP